MSPLRITFATAALTLAVAAPVSAKTTAFGGGTHAGEPIALIGDGKAKQLRSATIAIDSQCSDGSSWPFVGTLKASDMTRNAKARFAGGVNEITTDGGTPVFEVLSLSGRLAAHRASGTLSLKVDFVDGSKTCRSGTVKWAAVRDPKHVYAGATTQDEPVVVHLNPKRTRVTDVLVGWETSTCTPDHWYRQGDDLGAFPLHATHFGDGFSRTFDDGDGGKVTLDYTVHGAVKRTRSTGTLRVGLTDTDAGGSTALTCDSGLTHWTATTG